MNSDRCNDVYAHLGANEMAIQYFSMLLEQSVLTHLWLVTVVGWRNSCCSFITGELWCPEIVPMAIMGVFYHNPNNKVGIMSEKFFPEKWDAQVGFRSHARIDLKTLRSTSNHRKPSECLLGIEDFYKVIF